MTMKTKDNGNREQLAMHLVGVLADTYTLYNSTQVCHWNVEGPNFKSLHDLFEEQYTDLAGAVDMIAERLRAIDYYTPGTLADLRASTRVEQPESFRDTTAMIRHLIEGNQLTAHRLRATLQAAEDQADEATADMLIERLRVHEKSIWMLRSLLDEDSERLRHIQSNREAALAAS